MLFGRITLRIFCTLFVMCLMIELNTSAQGISADRFKGKFYSGKGDLEFLEQLDISRRMFDPDPEFQNLPMLYSPIWNGIGEGPKWKRAFWVQNSYGPTYCALPFYTEPYLTFLQNSQDMWFERMGDGKTEYYIDIRAIKGICLEFVPPDGCFVLSAGPYIERHRQGDGTKIDFNDYAIEITAAGILLQAELLLISRDIHAVKRYLPMLERMSGFIETRRDSTNNLFLSGPAGNLLAPSYGGWLRDDGRFDRGYLAGISVTYIAALDRLIELEKLIGSGEKVDHYIKLRSSARKGLILLTTDEGYLIKSLDPDGTKHGLYGAVKHGYFESVVNHDAIAFRVVDDDQAHKIYNKIASIPNLRPYGVIITNYPSLDDMYFDESVKGLWEFGRWVNGGFWSTCEARMIMGYFRLGKFEDVRRSMRHFIRFARSYNLDSPMTNFGGEVWNKNDPIHFCYDNMGQPAAVIRGLFEYLYRADGLTILPHIPPAVTELQQRFPIRFGTKKLYLSTAGSGTITAVMVNSKPWTSFDAESVFLPYEETPETAQIQIALGGAELAAPLPLKKTDTLSSVSNIDSAPKELDALNAIDENMRELYDKFVEAGLGESYEAAHVRLVINFIAAIYERYRLLNEGKIKKLPEASHVAANRLYLNTALNLYKGLDRVFVSYKNSASPHKRHVYQIWYKENTVKKKIMPQINTD